MKEIGRNLLMMKNMFAFQGPRLQWKLTTTKKSGFGFLADTKPKKGAIRTLMASVRGRGCVVNNEKNFRSLAFSNASKVSVRMADPPLYFYLTQVFL
jgi:hypothetical protein